MMTEWSSLFGRIPPARPGIGRLLARDDMTVDDVEAGVMGYLVDPCAFFVERRIYPGTPRMSSVSDTYVPFEGTRRPCTVLDVKRVGAGFITAITVRDEVTGRKVSCTRLSLEARMRMGRAWIPTQVSAPQDVFFSTRSSNYMTEVYGMLWGDDPFAERRGGSYAAPSRTLTQAEARAWEERIVNLRDTALSRRRDRTGVQLALRLGTTGHDIEEITR